ncbi:MAG: HAMP domain-containing protein [Eubacteriales bacterium]
MRNKISNQFFINYLIVFLLSILAAIFALLLLSFADSVISKTLVKNQYPASLLMQDNYSKINVAHVVDNGGGLQIINEHYRVVHSAGINTLGHEQLTPSEFTDFLIQSKSKGVQYHYDILYNENEKFWLIVTFPASIRLDFSLVYNKEAASKDMDDVTGAFIAVIIFYLILLAIFAVIFSKFTSVRITRPLKKLCESTKRLKEGDYSTRVDLHLKNEFAELQDTFNEMAERIECETALRRQSEDDRKKMIMDISHDLKNPLASITGYAELCLNNQSLWRKNIKIIWRLFYKIVKEQVGFWLTCLNYQNSKVLSLS